mmetsp:Transcript_32202/g.67123  ORF Transcript_32202/g.67123 Transcript_32202/m.67123 type:complete len:388 (-) Transcript_32202:105-1268(-)
MVEESDSIESVNNIVKDLVDTTYVENRTGGNFIIRNNSSPSGSPNSTRHQERVTTTNNTTSVAFGDIESVQSGLSSISGDASTSNLINNNNRKANVKKTPKKNGPSFFPKMDTVAHSRKNANRLAVPTGAETPSPFPRKAGAAAPTLTLSAWQYWSRLTDLRQMDMQSALDQMKTLLSTRPQVVYKTSYYRKQTKNHWARDDPAFLFLQGVFLIIAAVAYSVAFRISVTGSISFLLYTVVWNWLGMGLALATLCREIANRQLVGQQTATSTSHVRQQVEWLYAFDIHCNSFFPVFVVLYGLQFFLLPIVLGEGLVPLILANLLYAAALSWYWYITHLGYRSLPFLGNTEVFLFPIAAIALVFVGSVVGYPFGFGANAARVMARFYFM